MTKLLDSRAWLIPSLGALFLQSGLAVAADCNKNGVPDDEDLSPGVAFRTGVESPTEGQSGPLAPGDVDGDGSVDLVLIGSNFSRLPFLRNQGNGAFEAPQLLELPQATTVSLGLAAQLDGDGLTDIALEGYDEVNPATVMFLWSEGRGNFSEARGPSLRQAAWAMVAADFDQDGDNDLAFLTQGAVSQVELVLNGGDREFTTSVIAILALAVDLTASDLDGDGLVDIAVAAPDEQREAPGSVTLLFNRPDALFSKPVNLPVDPFPSTLRAGDLDADGDEDLVVSHEGNSPAVTLLFNDARGGFVERSTVSSSRYPYLRGQVLLADMNGDGSSDILLECNSCAIGSNYLILWPSTGGGHFGGKVQLVNAVNPNGGRYYVTADFDGDGNLDVADEEVVGATGSVAVYVTERAPPRSKDLNENHVPDECEVFRRGDADPDGQLDVSDPLAVLDFLFLGVPSELGCAKSADSDDDGLLSVSDAIYLLRFLFLGGPDPQPPVATCGADPTPDALPCRTNPPCGW